MLQPGFAMTTCNLLLGDLDRMKKASDASARFCGEITCNVLLGDPTGRAVCS